MCMKMREPTAESVSVVRRWFPNASNDVEERFSLLRDNYEDGDTVNS